MGKTSKSSNQKISQYSKLLAENVTPKDFMIHLDLQY